MHAEVRETPPSMQITQSAFLGVPEHMKNSRACGSGTLGPPRDRAGCTLTRAQRARRACRGKGTAAADVIRRKAGRGVVRSVPSRLPRGRSAPFYRREGGGPAGRRAARKDARRLTVRNGSVEERRYGRAAAGTGGAENASSNGGSLRTDWIRCFLRDPRGVQACSASESLGRGRM